MTKLSPETQLRRDVQEELDWDALVDESQIDVVVSEGVVTLVGTVDSYAHKVAARDAAQVVAGVHDLVDEIDVKVPEGGFVSDDELRGMVEQILAWDALVPDQHVAVSVSHGYVTLAGSVSVDSQRREAERAIAHLTGIRGVVNNIEVQEPDSALDDVHAAIERALRRRAEHRAAHIDVTVDGRSVILEGTTQSRLEKVAVMGVVRHAPGIDMVCDELRIEPES